MRDEGMASMAQQMVLGPYIASQLTRLQQALREENEFNVCIVLAEAESLLTNPANEPLISLESDIPSFELAVFRMWSTVQFGVLDANYDSTVAKRAHSLTNVLSDVIREHLVLAHCRPGGWEAQPTHLQLDLDREP